MAYWPTLHAGCLWLTGPRYSLAVCGSLAHAIGWLFVAHWATVQVGCLWLTGPRKGWMFVAHWLMLQAGYLWLTGPRYRLAVCGALGHGTGWLFVAHWLMLQAGCLWLIGPCYRLAVCGSLGRATGWLFVAHWTVLQAGCLWLTGPCYRLAVSNRPTLLENFWPVEWNWSISRNVVFERSQEAGQCQYTAHDFSISRYVENCTTALVRSLNSWPTVSLSGCER